MIRGSRIDSGQKALFIGIPSFPLTARPAFPTFSLDGAVAKLAKASDCKSDIPGSNPGGASSFPAGKISCQEDAFQLILNAAAAAAANRAGAWSIMLAAYSRAVVLNWSNGTAIRKSGRATADRVDLMTALAGCATAMFQRLAKRVASITPIQRWHPADGE